MPIQFEVRETDLMGRVGTLTVGGKRVETPCLTPVIHPTFRDIPISWFEEMGFRALMTNSYIAYRRKKEEALAKGLHRMIGYDGVLMTDSGGYQVLVYGDAEVSPIEIAEFQAGIGSDLAVTLDRPTGYSGSRGYARETMTVSLQAARETLRRFRDSRTTWVGPIQGGIFSDLLRSSARGLVKEGFEFLALGSPVELMEGYLFRQLVEMIVAARKAIPYSMPLHLFGAGHPLTLPLSVALGCDTFDSASYMLFAQRERYMTERGTLELRKMAYLPCSCPACNSTTVLGLVEMPRPERTLKLALHNLYLLRADVLRCRQAIVEGRLWDLVEERASVHPRALLGFRELAKHAEWLGEHTPALKDRGLMVRSEEDRGRPELLAARKRLDSVMRRGGTKKRAVLIPHSRVKPLAGRRTGIPLSVKPAAPDVDVYRLHPELGPYPAELVFVYPFTQTVSLQPAGDVRDAVKRLRALGYARVAVAGKLPRKKARRRARKKARRR